MVIMVLRESFVVVSSQTKGPQGERCCRRMKCPGSGNVFRGRQESRQ